MEFPLDEVQKYVALAAGIAGIVGGLLSGLLSWFLRLTENWDSIRVRVGAVHYMQEPYECMHVINRSKHQITVSDYGFITRDGKLMSIQEVMENHMGDQTDYYSSGKLTMEKLNDYFEVWVGYHIVSSKNIIGCWAMTITQTRLRLDFYSSPQCTWRERWSARLRIATRHWRHGY